MAWLGKKVVDGNLIPGSITLHMLGALAILGLQLAALRAAGATAPTVNTHSRRWIWTAAILTVAQLVFGTQVREAVDHLVHEGVARADIDFAADRKVDTAYISFDPELVQAEELISTVQQIGDGLYAVEAAEVIHYAPETRR